MPILQDDTHFFFEGYLTLHPRDGIKFTHGTPARAGGGSRIMALEIKVPKSVFQTPALKASIDISDENLEAIQINTEACADVLKEVVGADVTVKLQRPTEDET